MQEKFVNEAIAILRLEQERFSLLKKFCPVTNSLCKRHCMSFYEGQVYEVKLPYGRGSLKIESHNVETEIKYKIALPECTNAIVRGAIFCTGDFNG